LESFPAWLRSLGADATALAEVLESSEAPAISRSAAGSLTYLAKSLDLIPDGLEDLGYIDDAFVLRVAAARVPDGLRELDTSGVFARLAADAELVREFLGDDYGRLETYVDKLESSAARGRSVEQVLGDAEARAGLCREVRAWAGSYGAPTFASDAKNLVKLRSFMKNRLP
jgi:uncharacterized membrane protein YkvA (DUF1232 family)